MEHHIHSPDSPSETTFSVKPQWYYLTAFCIWQQQTVMAILLIVLLPLCDAGGGGGIRTHGPLRVSGFLDRCTRPGYAIPPNIQDAKSKALLIPKINA